MSLDMPKSPRSCIRSRQFQMDTVRLASIRGLQKSSRISTWEKGTAEAGESGDVAAFAAAIAPKPGSISTDLRVRVMVAVSPPAYRSWTGDSRESIYIRYPRRRQAV